MSPVRTKYVPWFGSQQGPGQRDEPQPEHIMDQTEPSCQAQRNKRGNKRANVTGEKTRSILKVKLPKLNKKATKEEKTQRRWMLEPVANKTKTTEGGGRGAQCAGTDSDTAGGDVFFFSQVPSSKAVNQKEKAKLAVIRNISKVLEENQLIRQRLAALSHAN